MGGKSDLCKMRHSYLQARLASGCSLSDYGLDLSLTLSSDLVRGGLPSLPRQTPSQRVTSEWPDRTGLAERHPGDGTGHLQISLWHFAFSGHLCQPQNVLAPHLPGQ